MFDGVNPQGVRVVSFKAPVGAELQHDYLWRVHAALPPRGRIGVFNRSHYEDIVTVGVLGLAPEAVWRRRGGHIREFERMRVDGGTAIVKVFLNVSKDEQAERLRERIDDPTRRWKFRAGDLEVSERYDEYRAGYEAAITETRPIGRRGASCPPIAIGSRPTRPLRSSVMSSSGSTRGCRRDNRPRHTIVCPRGGGRGYRA